MLIKLTDYLNDETFYIEQELVEKLVPVMRTLEDREIPTTMLQLKGERTPLEVYGNIDEVAKKINGET